MNGIEKITARIAEDGKAENDALLAQARAEAADIAAKYQAQAKAAAEEILAQGQCLSLKDLAVDGRDVIAAGIAPGPEVGRTLNALLERAVSGEVENQREVLLELLRK